MLSACSSKELEFTVDELTLSTGEEDGLVGELVVNSFEPGVAFIKEQNGKFVVTELNNDKQNKVSKEYLEIGEISFGKNRLFFSAKKDNGKWIIVEDFLEKGNEYDSIKHMVTNDKDQIFFIGHKEEKDIIVLNYEEEYEEKEILGFAVSNKYDLHYVYTAYGEDGNWYVKDRAGYDSGPLSYATAPKYFENSSFAAIARTIDGDGWISIIDGVEEPIIMDAMEIGDFALSSDNQLALAYLKPSEKWTLLQPFLKGVNYTQEYNYVKDLMYGPDDQLVYTVVKRTDPFNYEIRTWEKEIVLASSLNEINNQYFLDGHLVYATKVEGRDWELYIENQLVGAYKRISPLITHDGKLVLAAEIRNKGISRLEIEID